MFLHHSKSTENNSVGEATSLRARAARRSRGLTLAELLISISVVSMIGLALAVLTTAVRTTRDYADRQGLAAQTARVVLERIESTVDNAKASIDFPGIAVFSATSGSYSFPDTLVVWHPTGLAANAAGPPLYKELVIYCPDPASPSRLLEITVPNDTRTTPPLSDTTTWTTELNTIKNSTSSTKTLLTDLMRTASTATVTGGSGTTRGAVRFRVLVRPSIADYTSYLGGSTTWANLNWVQDIHGSQAGLRQAWCSIELQLMPGKDIAAQDPTGKQVIPFFGSAALYYQMKK